MSKLSVLFIFASVLFFNLYSKDSIPKSFPANVNPTVTPTPANSNETSDVILDKKTVYIACQSGIRPARNADCGDMLITVTNSADAARNNTLAYSYTVSGGRVTGEGEKVRWDLTGAMPGTYRIRIDIEDKSKNQTRTATKIVTVLDCECIIDCFCPALWINTPPSPTQAGETMTFTANISGGSADKVTYNWTISDGKIIEGQGTPVIKVATNSRMTGKIVTATAEFVWDGFCWEDCNKTASASGSVIGSKKRKGK